jgi:hypothetical protein
MMSNRRQRQYPDSLEGAILVGAARLASNEDAFNLGAL